MYPRIIINQNKLVENANTILEMARNNNIPYVTTVVKAFASLIINFGYLLFLLINEASDILCEGTICHSSRILHL